MSEVLNYKIGMNLEFSITNQAIKDLGKIEDISEVALRLRQAAKNGAFSLKEAGRQDDDMSLENYKNFSCWRDGIIRPRRF